MPSIWIGSLVALGLLLQRRHFGIFLLLAATVPILTLTPIAGRIAVAAHYSFLYTLGWFTLTALAVELLYREKGAGGLLALGLIALPLVAFLYDDLEYFTYKKGYRRDWKGAMEVVQRERLPGDLVLAGEPRLASYYLKEEVQHIRGLDPQLVAAQGRRVWIVLDTKADWLEPELWQPYEKHSRLVADFDAPVGRERNVMRVYLYDP